jgi:hypothetical protein
LETTQTPSPEEHPILALWALIFGHLSGHLCLFSGHRPAGGKLEAPAEQFFPYPDERDAALAWVAKQQAAGRDVYACAHLLAEPRRAKPHAQPLLTLYADGDGAQPPEAFPPSAVVETSPGRHHFFWRLSRPVAPALGEDLNKRLAYLMGADKSGWDLTQLVRLPGTTNHKYAPAPEVTLADLNDRAYDPDDLAARLPPIARTSRAEANAGPPVRLSPAAMAIWEGRSTKTTAEGEVDRSASLFRIGRVLFNAGAAPDVAVAALAERDETLGWNKYSDRPRAEEEYRRIVDKIMNENTATARPNRASGIAPLIWAHQLGSLPTLEWLIDGIAPAGGLGVLVGPPGSGKTFLLLDIASCIATGTDWHGCAVKQGAVVYVYAEGVAGLRARVEAWSAAHGKNVERVAFIRHAVNLVDQQSAGNILARLKEEGVQPVAIIIDTLARAMTGADESGSRDMGLVVATAGQLQTETGAAVWFAHHPKKGGGEYRGSSALGGSTDTIISAQKSGTTITLRCEKQKDAPHFEPFALTLVESGTSLALAPTVAGGVGPGPGDVSEAALAIYAVLVEAGPSGLRHGPWLASCGSAKNEFNRHLKELQEAAMIRKGDGGRNAPWVAIVAGDSSAEKPTASSTGAPAAATTGDANCRCDDHEGGNSCANLPPWVDDDFTLHCPVCHTMPGSLS